MCSPILGWPMRTRPPRRSRQTAQGQPARARRRGQRSRRRREQIEHDGDAWAKAPSRRFVVLRTAQTMPRSAISDMIAEPANDPTNYLPEVLTGRAVAGDPARWPIAQKAGGIAVA